jgi:hypothetical protein
MTLIGVATLAALAPMAARADVAPPFTENFSVDDSNWGTNNNTVSGGEFTVPPVYTNNGGVDGAGDGFIGYNHTWGVFNPSIPTTVIFRANDNTNSSGDAFKGNWINAGVNEISFYARHDESVPMTAWLRVAPNGPAWNIRGTDVPVGNGWSLVSFPISLAAAQAGYGDSWVYSTATPNVNDAPAQYAAAFSAVVNMQVSFEQEGLAQGSTTLFELDGVTVVPEPTGAAVLAGAGALGLLKRRRRRRTAKAVVAVASVAGVTGVATQSASALNPTYFNQTVPQFENPAWWAGSPDPIPADATAQQWDTFLDGLGNAVLSGPGTGENNFLFNDAVTPPAVSATGINNSIYIFSQAGQQATIPTDTVVLQPGGGTYVNVQIAATVGANGTGLPGSPITVADFAILPGTLRLTDLLGNTLPGGAAGEVTNYEVTSSYQGTFEFFPGFPVKGEHYLYQFFLPGHSGDFRVAWTEQNHSVFDALRVDTLTVVPEPASTSALALASLPCGAMLGRRYRRRVIDKG